MCGRYSPPGAATAGVNQRVRLLALGGIVGPVAFVLGWAVSGAVTVGYSPIDDAISDLAAVGASTRVAMTVAFIAFGIGVIAFGEALHQVLEGRAWIAAIATGACTIGVAATPLGGWSGDGVHAAFAGLGYFTLVLLPLLAASPLVRAGRRGRGRVSTVVATTSGVCLAASTLGPAHGLWQRAGLTIGDAWIIVSALYVVAGTRRTEVPCGKVLNRGSSHG